MMDRRLFLGAGVAGASALTFSSVFSQNTPNFGVPTLPEPGFRKMGFKKTGALGGWAVGSGPRILPEGLHAHIDADAWAQPRLMAFLQAQGHIEPEEMARTFNCGIGMAVVVAKDDAATVKAALEAAGETVYSIGHVAAGDTGCTVSGSMETWSAQSDWTATHNV